MKRTVPLIALLVLLCGCASNRWSACGAPPHDDVAVFPGGSGVGALLLSASESEWRKEADVPQTFGDDGMPVVDTTKPAAAMKFKRFGFRLGVPFEIHSTGDSDSPTSGPDPEFREDGPMVGLYMRLGGRGKFAVEFGYDSLFIQTESHFFDGNESHSQLHAFRFGGGLFLGGATSRVRPYLQSSYRHAIENVEIYTGSDDEQFTNSASGWGVTAGLLTGQFDLRFEHFELGGVGSIGFDALTVAYRF